jgi:hypothetical protein
VISQYGSFEVKQEFFASDDTTVVFVLLQNFVCTLYDNNTALLNDNTVPEEHKSYNFRTEFKPKYSWSRILRQWTPVVASVIKMHPKPADTMLCHLYCSQQLHIWQTMAACLNWYLFHSLSMHFITNIRWDIKNITMWRTFYHLESNLKTTVSLLDL